jgi:hypothetical protein
MLKRGYSDLQRRRLQRRAPLDFLGVEIAVAGMNTTGQALRIGDALEEPVQLIWRFVVW